MCLPFAEETWNAMGLLGKTGNARKLQTTKSAVQNLGFLTLPIALCLCVLLMCTCMLCSVCVCSAEWYGYRFEFVVMYVWCVNGCMCDMCVAYDMV